MRVCLDRLCIKRLTFRCQLRRITDIKTAADTHSNVTTRRRDFICCKCQGLNVTAGAYTRNWQPVHIRHALLRGWPARPTFAAVETETPGQAGMHVAVAGVTAAGLAYFCIYKCGAGTAARLSDRRVHRAMPARKKKGTEARLPGDEVHKATPGLKRKLPTKVLRRKHKPACPDHLPKGVRGFFRKGGPRSKTPFPRKLRYAPDVEEHQARAAALRAAQQAASDAKARAELQGLYAQAAADGHVVSCPPQLTL